MDVKHLSTEPALRERNNDGSKYTQGGVATLHSHRNKSYQDIGSNPLAKTEGVSVRPCAVIGPDRVVPPPAASDAFLKKGSVEPWPSHDNGYRRPPDNPHRLHQNPVRNISPRQTFQENMQRINVPPTYNAVRHSDSANFNHIQERSVSISKNVKPNMVPEAKYCDVPYAINALTNESKNVRDSEMYVSSVNSQLTRSVPHVWPPGSVNVNAPRTYSVNEPYQYPQYTSCAGQRPPIIPVPRPQRPIQEDPAYVYPDHYYRDPIGRLKPYPPVKERCPQPRYEYISNYGSQFHPPPPIQPLKYDIPKPSQTHPYPAYPHFKYLDNRVPEPNMESYQRSTSHQPHYNLPLRTQVIHPPYSQVPVNGPQKVQPYPLDGSVKGFPPNKLHYDTSSKMYIDFENSRAKPYPMTDNYYVSEMNRIHSLKNQMVMPNYSPLGMRAMPSQQYYLKDNTQMKPFEYMPTFRNFEPHLTGNPVLRHAPQFSPNTLAISPTDSSTSNDTSQTHGTSQEDCGYVSQSSTTSVRSIDSGIHRLPHEYYKRHEFRYGPIVGSSQSSTKTDLNSKDSKQKQIDVRQFLQMWNEGEEENNSDNNNSKEIIVQTGSSDKSHFPKHVNAEDQLYVLGLVNVSSEDLSKYEHIEKISKLPENIKGYNNLELFSRFEEAMESCNTTTFKTHKQTIPKEYQNPLKDHSTKLITEARSVSPLDVEAKISQSIIHKEVGCNFEIKPCSPKMLNVEMAAPAQNILGERIIEKVSNPLSKIVKSPLPTKSDENPNCHPGLRQENVFAITDNPSCKMIHSPFSSSNLESVKTNYTLQDLEINSGMCLASLPQLDNEIELNFPEVNQQFINANKKDVFSTATNCNLNKLQEDSSNLSDNKEDKLDSERNKLIPTDFDKTFNKLSKYRKSKANAADITENKNKAVRTDSVIIKNPENIENKMLENSLNIPINLSSQSSQWYSLSAEPNKNKDNDIALDFSLNKSSNDLPIIETEKEMIVKQFQTNHSHMSCESILPTDMNASCQESCINEVTVNPKTAVESMLTDTNNASFELRCPDLSSNDVLPTDSISYKKSVYENDFTDNSKEGFVECIQTDTKTSYRVHNIEIENKSDTNSSEVIRSTAMIKNNENPDLNSTRSGNLIFEKKNYVFDAHSIDDNNKVSNNCINMNSEKSQEPVDKKCTDKNTVMLKSDSKNDKDNWENNFENCGNLITTHSETKRNKEIENINQFFRPEVNKCEQLITSQNENDFEHDEISASLEKLFRDSNEEISLTKIDNCSPSLDSKSIEKNVSRQSKELYSPWIQKLLTHSEGSCSYNEPPQKRIIKSIFDPDELYYKPVQSNKFSKDVLEQKNVFGCDERITSTTYIEPKDSTPTHESNTQNETAGDFTYSIKKNTPKSLNEEHDIVTVEKLCKEKVSHHIASKRNSECNVDTSKRKIKRRKLVTGKISKKIRDRGNEYSTNIKNKIDKKYCKIKAKQEPEIKISNKPMCDLGSVVQNNLTIASNVYNIVSDNTEKQSKENNSDSSVVSDILNSGSDLRLDAVVRYVSNETIAEIVPDLDLDLNTVVQDDLNEPIPKNISDSDLKLHAVVQVEDLDESVAESLSDIDLKLDAVVQDGSDETIAERVSDSHLILDAEFQDDSSEIVAKNVFESDLKFDAAVQDDSDETIAESVSNSDSDLAVQDDSNLKIIENMSCVVPYCSFITEDQINENTSKDNIIASICADTNQDTGKTDSGIFSEHLDERSVHQNVIANVIKQRRDMNNKVDIIDAKIKANSTVNNDQNVPDKSCESSSDNCTSLETEEPKHLEHIDRLIHHDAKDADKSSETSNISSKVFNDPKSLSNSLSSYYIKDNQSIDIFVGKRNSNKDIKKVVYEFKRLDTDYDHDVISQKIHYRRSSKTNASNICTKDDEEKQNQAILTDALNESSNNHLNKVSESLNTFEIVCANKNQEDAKICSDCDSDISRSLLKKDISEHTHGDIEMHVVSATLGNANIIYKKDAILQEDRRSSGLENSTRSEIQKSQCEENITENVSEGLTEKENNCAIVKSDTENRSDKDYLSNDKHDTSENNFLKSCETKEIASKEIILNDSIVYAEESFSDSKFESHSININDNYIEPQTEVESEEISRTRNKIILKDSDISSKSCDNNMSSEPKSSLQEYKCDNTFKKISVCVSELCVEEYIEQPTLINEVNAASEDNVCCADKDDNLCDAVVENNMCELGTNLSNKHNLVQENPVKQRLTLKRSFSDSDLNRFKNRETSDRQLIDNTPMWPPKRQKIYEINDSEEQTIDENFSNFIQNRRNSISSYYNAENVSFCILIDNDCILAEESNGDKICFAEVSEDCITEVNTADVEDNLGEVMYSPDDSQLHFSESVMLGIDDEKSVQEAWIDDVACVETVVSEDIVEEPDKDAICFSKDSEVSNYDESGFFNSEMIEHESNFASEEVVQDNVSEFESTYRSLHGDDKIMYDEEPHYMDRYNDLYNGQCLEKILSKSYRRRSPSPTSDYTESVPLSDDTSDPKLPENKENICVKNIKSHNFESKSDYNRNEKCLKEDHNSVKRTTSEEIQQREINKHIDVNETSCSTQHNNTVNLPESSIDNVFNYKFENDDDASDTTSSSSPEVSSTTFDEKSSTILLKITNYNGSRVSEINEVNHSNKPRCKFTESKDYSHSHGSLPKRPLITKAAQKYIPPIKESISDLKVKLPLPQQRLLKLKQLKLSRSKPKIAKQNNVTIPKKQKPKPNFEDVLKNIDEVQIKMHKQNIKKNKNVVPKVFIKKNVNGSHYTSSSSKEKFNPDLTGRKWQPWVFLERNRLIDNMAMKNKTRAIFSYRKKTYVLYEEFKKYKSVSNSSAKFVITQPKQGNSSKGQLKYTIRLKLS